MSDSERTIDRRTVLRGIGATGLAAGVGGAALLAATGGAAAQASIDMTINDATVSNDRGDLDFVGVNLTKTITWDGFDKPVKYIGFKHEVATDANKKGWHTLYPSTQETGPNGDVISDKLPGWEDYGNDESVDEYTTDESTKPDGTKGTATAGIEWEIINGSGEPGQYASFGYDGGGVQDPAAWASDLSVSGDGVSKTHRVRFRTTLYFYSGKDADGNLVQFTEADGVPSQTGTGTFYVTVTNETAELTGTESTGNSVAQ
jgi:hypothetical protein